MLIHSEVTKYLLLLYIMYSLLKGNFNKHFKKRFHDNISIIATWFYGGQISWKGVELRLKLQTVVSPSYDNSQQL